MGCCGAGCCGVGCCDVDCCGVGCFVGYYCIEGFPDRDWLGEGCEKPPHRDLHCDLSLLRAQERQEEGQWQQGLLQQQ